MVNASFRVASCELETNPHRDAGETRRQENRQGIFALKSGPPTWGSGGVADREVRPFQVSGCRPSASGPRACSSQDGSTPFSMRHYLQLFLKNAPGVMRYPILQSRIFNFGLVMTVCLYLHARYADMVYDREPYTPLQASPTASSQELPCVIQENRTTICKGALAGEVLA